jgi:hypothetical protein
MKIAATLQRDNSFKLKSMQLSLDKKVLKSDLDNPKNWRPDTIEGFANDEYTAVHALTLLDQLSGSKTYAHGATWSIDLPSQARTRSQVKATSSDASSRSSVHSEFGLAAQDLVSGVRFRLEQVAFKLCFVVACVNSIVGVFTVAGILEGTGSEDPAEKQVMHWLDQQGITNRPLDNPDNLSPPAFLDWFLQTLSDRQGRWAVQASAGHAVTFLVGPNQAVIIDSDPSHPEPVPLTRDNFVNVMGYDGIWKIWQLVLPKRVNKRLAQMKLEQSVRDKLR